MIDDSRLDTVLDDPTPGGPTPVGRDHDASRTMGAGWNEGEIESNETRFRGRERTSRQEASNGQQFPCLAPLIFLIVSFFSYFNGSRAAAPVGDEVLE